MKTPDATMFGGVKPAVWWVTAGSLALVWNASWLASWVEVWAGPCRFRGLTGLSCVFCGGTRALTALGNGAVWESLVWNPLVVGTACAACGWPIWGRWVEERLDGRGSRVFAWVLFAGLANWVYVGLRGAGYFWT